MSFDELTISEREIARMVARGMTNRQIATLRGVKAGTVRMHLRNTYRRLGIHAGCKAAQLAAEYTRWKMGTR